MELFTIGDSVSQGFMSGAAARTDLCYSTLIAKAMGLQPGNNYNFPKWPKGGLPCNLEELMRALSRRYGADINALEWLTILSEINKYIDQSEDYYERGAGNERTPYDSGKVDFFHNISVEGFKVADAWNVCPALCKEIIAEENLHTGGDNYLFNGWPNAAFYRIAHKVLNPSLDGKYDKFTQLDWLQHHVDQRGVKNLLLWLGNNNVLGSVVGLQIKQTRNSTVKMGHLKQTKWNLWHPDHFREEYDVLLNKVAEIMGKNNCKTWRVFVGNIPLLTILPIAKGVGPSQEIKDRGIYYKYYTYFPFEEEFAKKTGNHLTMDDAIYIDECITEYNKTIGDLINSKNDAIGHKAFFLVDISKMLSDLAWKRNEGRPPFNFEAVDPIFKYKYPRINTKYYHADMKGRFRQGGIFSLDGVHPTAIAHGLIANEFMKVMGANGVNFPGKLDWKQIFRDDTLYSNPISLMQEVYNHEKLAMTILDIIKFFR